MKLTSSLCILLSIAILFPFLSLKAGAFIELSPGYTVPFGAWRSSYGKGFSVGGMAGFTFSEFVNPGIGGFLFLPKTGKRIEDEYKAVHNTEYISLFTSTGLIYISNRIDLALNDSDNLSLDIGYGIHSQRSDVTIINDNYGTSENFSGHGPYIGIGLQKKMQFSVFDYIMPFFKVYFSPNTVYYHILDTDASIINHDVANERYGFIAGVSLISIGEE